MLISQLCRQIDFDAPWFIRACEKLREGLQHHRKLWEFCYIYEALRERGLLQPGMKGLGFGVGREPLAAAFAAAGCQILATDLDAPRAAAQGWLQTQQHASGADVLNDRGLCTPEEFRERVSFEVVDMNLIPAELHGQFDFTWSSCSFEHCGSIELGLKFVRNQMACLKPGGIAVHTTEFNVSSNRDTVATGQTVLFRRRDLERLARRLRRHGHVVDLDFTLGEGEIERHIDVPPYTQQPHLRLQLFEYTATSIGLIIEKAACRVSRPRRWLNALIGT